MANPLSELFGKIAKSIRGGLGDTGKMKPASFPDKIDEIVGMIETDSGEIDDVLDEINGEIVGENIYTITFKQYDGSETYGTLQAVENDSCQNPITTNVFEEPIRESTVEHDFSFAGWSREPNGTIDINVLSKITEDLTLYAVYSSDLRKYTVIVYDGDRILETQTVKYGYTPSFKTPEKYGYMFDKWEPEIAPVTGDISYYAQWIQGSFSAASWSEVARICESGKATEYFSVGDEKVVNAEGGSAVVKIAGFNHDDLADGSGKASLSIVLGTVADYEHTYNETNDTGTYVYWEDSQLRAVIAPIESVLPQDLRAVIAPVFKEYNRSIQGYTGYHKATDRLWALSPREVGLLQTSGPGEKYELFETLDNKSLTKFGNETKVSYWLRDHFSPTTWYCVNEEGDLNSKFKGESAYIHFGFCIK